MYGLIEKIVALPGQRDELIAVLMEVSRDMPGCLSYVVARDRTEANAVWITEVWDGPHSHGAAQVLPAVQQAIAKGRALIESFGGMTLTEPVGGHGLASLLRR
ncbi:MAG: antibiotic biosynthesis monooxygenase [Rhizobacter sp.]|nr:antibiotic biosynthesis monooxygenase [Rhizobacter sp.]